MPIDEGSGGLLSKVVKFVKNPTTSWGDLDALVSVCVCSYSKQMLKEMIERKRRNDFVRKREFDMLRKMRRSEVMAGQDPAARPSFFQSSMPPKPDDRATTLKKIDEIEAQMSMQWWKTKHGDNSSRLNTTGSFQVSAHVPPEAPQRPATAGGAARSTSYIRTEPQPLDPGKAPAAPAPPEELLPNLHVSPMVQAPSVPPPPSALRPSAAQAPASPPRRGLFSPARSDAGGNANSEGGASTAFTASKMFAIDIDEFAHDPELEEAAIRFANGDDAGAEAGLLEVLGAKGARAEHEESWLTLFDLYRAT